MFLFFLPHYQVTVVYTSTGAECVHSFYSYRRAYDFVVSILTSEHSGPLRFPIWHDDYWCTIDQPMECSTYAEVYIELA